MVRRAQVVLGLAVLVAFALASSSPSQGAPGAKPPDFDKAVAALEKHGDKWLDKPGVVGVGIGVNKAGKAVIHVYKIKDDDEGIPSDVDGVAVAQVRSGRFDPRAAPTDRWPRPVPIGVSSGLADFATGTLGARVTNGTNVYALSNNHVFAGVNTASIGDPITQPGPDDGGSDPGDRIATLADYQEIDFNGGDNTMDAAIALTSAGDVGTATPPDGYGAPGTTPAAASIGMGVQKYGRTTGLQLGTVQDVSLMVDVCYAGFGEFCFPGFEARFVNQISVSPGTFSAPGDSGSLMVTQGGNQPVALLFAGDGNLTIGNPIIPVLQRFNVTIEGGPPVNGPPTAPTNLRATAGDDLVELTWNAPTFDGGSAVTHYRVFRGLSPGNEDFLASSTSPFHTDATAENGTTYYYKVSAVNGNGEGPLSNGANATPVALVTPGAPLTVLDDFNRADENPLSDAGRWSNAIIGGESGHHVTSNQLACSVATTCTAWRNNAQFGPDVEVYARLSTLPGVNNQLRLYARLQLPGHNGYLLWANQLSGTDEVWLDRFAGGGGVRLLTISQELTAGDIMLLRVHGASIEAWRHNGSAWSRLGVVQDATYGAPGYVGVGLRGTTGRVDDFGARGLGTASPPGAPTGLSATAGDAQVALTWSAPFDGGSPITGYKVYRATSPGGETLLPTPAIISTSYTDTTAANGTTYYYKVSAVNAVDEGPLSNEASATPVALVPPSAPLAIVDNFNRPNENPLSDAGKWSNAIIGGESGHHVSSNQLACAVATTCTAWRNNAQYGPDVEVYARFTTLPGVNNQLRLYARLQLPGLNGYLLRTLQQSGTDEVWLERFDGGSAVRLLTISQELTAGDTILLRAKGTSIEAWRHNGTAWSRLGFVQSAVHSAAGFVGVGLRGTTGRLDDFGARTLGGAPATPPTAPQNLQATAGNAQVALTWSAPASDGGSPVTSYKLYRGTSPGGETLLPTPTITATGYTDTTAANGTTYYYKVSAVNAVDEGPLSNEASATPIAPATPPTAPQNLQATAGNAQVALTWSAPASDGGSPVTSYKLYRGTSPGGETLLPTPTITATGYTDTTAANGTTYYYKVSAVNAVDEGPLSNEASATPVAPATPPTAPQNLQATAGNAQVALTWSAPASDGGSPVTSYKLYRGTSPGGETLLPTPTITATGYTDTTAANGTTYYYKVSAVNAVDEGPLSNEASATPIAPATPPTAPQNLQATAGNAQVALTWSAPASDGGSPVTSYKLYRGTSPGGETLLPTPTITATGYTDTTAANGTTYYYKVSAVNAVDEGPLSNEASATPIAPATPPTAPQNLQATAGNAQVALTWSAPASDGGSPVTSYKLYRGTSPGGETLLPTPTITATGYTDTTAANGTTYYYKVSAVNAVDEGPLSNEASATPQPPPDTTPPSAPGTLSATTFSSNRIDLSWGAATDAVGVTLYHIERCEGPSCANFSEIATVNAPATSYQNTGLNPSISYTYRVRAEDAAHNFGLYSNLASATTHAAPKPIYLSLEANGTVGGISVANEDVVFFDGTTFSLAFDGSDVGLSSRRLDAFTWLDLDTLLFSLDNDGASLTGAGTVDDSDVVRFDASSLGSTTAGTFSMYFDGSDVGLTTNAEDVDAFERLANGNLLVSTEGSVGVTGVSGEDEDLLAFTPSTLGATTSGTFAMYFDGSDVGLTASGEDIDAAAVDSAGRIHLSTRNDFAVTGVSGADEDVFVFTPSTLGSSTTGTFSPSLYFDGSAFGLAGNNVFAIDLP